MGMGEPLDNLDNLIKTLGIMNEKEGLNIGARRITISTCGIVPAINKLAKLNLQVNLSISLHAANDKLRDQLMPVNKKYHLNRLTESLRSYFETTKRLLTLEYILINNINDSDQDAKDLAAIAKQLKAKINLIPYSRIPGFNYIPPKPTRIRTFEMMLLREGAKVTVRESRGKDIKAACGQLAGKRL